jgi:hypothetical protein
MTPDGQVTGPSVKEGRVQVLPSSPSKALSLTLHSFSDGAAKEGRYKFPEYYAL